ncbi:MAG TPA: GntR family transcriptional regulator [Gemmatimonadales bacterium]|nr:GntR family transcriptional regulator [Gemmatimonadales bacterium]
MSVFDQINPRSATPLYAQIAARIRGAIAAGELAPGDGLPSVRHLAGRLLINPATVVQAYRELESEGFVEMRQGAGTFVRDVPARKKDTERQQQIVGLARRVLAEAGKERVTAAELIAALQKLTGGNR